MDHQAKRRQVKPARRDIGCHTDTRAFAPQCLHCLITLALCMLARQRNRTETAIYQTGVETAHRFTRAAEQHGRFRFVETQQIDHRIFGICRSDCNCLIGNIAVTAIFANGRDSQRIILVTLGQSNNRLWHGCGEKQRLALFARRVQYFFQIFTEAHVEHFIRFVEHHSAQLAKVQRAAFQMVAQTAGRADNHMRAVP